MRVTNRRALLAAAAVAVAATVATVALRPAAAVPRFDEAAWTEATAVLAAEVGSAAVERGIVRVPRAPLEPVTRGAVQTVSSRRSVHDQMTTECERAELFVCPSGSILLSGDRGLSYSHIALLGCNEALHALRVIRYLQSATADGLEGAADEREDRQRAWVWTEKTQVSGDLLRVYDDSDVSAMALVRRRCICSYLGSLAARKTAGPAPGVEETAAAAAAILNDAVPASAFCDGVAANHMLSILAAYPSVAAREAVDRAESRRKQLERLSSYATLPVLGRVLPRGVEGEGALLCMAPDAVWSAQNLAGKTAEDQLATALASGKAFWYLHTRAEEAHDAHLAAAYAAAPAQHREEVWLLYRTGVYRRPLLAAAARSDNDGVLRFVANRHLYVLTGDRAHALACVAELTPFHLLKREQTVTEPGLFYRLLAMMYAQRPDLVEIPQGVLRSVESAPSDEALASAATASPVAAEAAYAVLVAAGGADNARAAGRIANAFEADAAAAAEYLTGSYYCGEGGIAMRRALAGARDEVLIEDALAFLKTDLPKLSNPLSEVYIDALAARGDVRVVGIVDAALAGAGEGARRRRCYDWFSPNKVPFRDLLQRARLTVEMRTSEDPIAFLLSRSQTEQALVHGPAWMYLAERMSVAQMEALLADDRSAPIRGAVYFALRERRCAERHGR